VTTKDCALCGLPMAPGRFLCAGHVELALEASAFYRQKARQAGLARVWITDLPTKESTNG
jgi:hypothetical protein